MAIFRGLPAPLGDETLTSWLFRCSVNQNVVIFDRRELEARPDWWWSGVHLNFSEPDFDFTSAFCRSVVASLGLDLNTISYLFAARSSAVAAWNTRHFFCPECLRYDISQRRLPSWKKSWCYENSVHCLEHRCELVRLRGSPKYSRAWDSFIQICNDKPLQSSWNDERFAEYRMACISRVYLWFDRTKYLDYSSRAVFNKLYNIFLQSPYRGSYGGVARILFQSKSAPRALEVSLFSDSIVRGPSTADIPSRVGSLILVATLLEIIPQNRVHKMAEHAETLNISWPTHAELSRSIFFPSVSRSDLCFLHEYLGRFDRKRWPLLDNFLGMQEQRYRREGVCSGLVFGA
jgi:hypothetical protein